MNEKQKLFEKLIDTDSKKLSHSDMKVLENLSKEEDIFKILTLRWVCKKCLVLNWSSSSICVRCGKQLKDEHKKV